MDPVPTMGDYNTAKFATVALLESLAMDLRSKNISITQVFPGIVRTPLSKNTERLLGEAITAPRPAPTSKEMEPLVAARIMLKAAAVGAPYCFTHPENRARVEGRFNRILEAFDLLNAPA
jgi:NAD(P)-dependent dehydrogenase (short-subunit alcohol dehydrogenase family)